MSHRSIALLTLVVLIFAITACSSSKEASEQANTSVPLATATMTSEPLPTNTPNPTATPRVVEKLPEGCLGYLSGLDQVVYLCNQEMRTIAHFEGNQCATVISEYNALIIHFRDVSSSEWLQTVKRNGETICSSGTAATNFQLWAEAR